MCHFPWFVSKRNQILEGAKTKQKKKTLQLWSLHLQIWECHFCKLSGATANVSLRKKTHLVWNDFWEFWCFGREIHARDLSACQHHATGCCFRKILKTWKHDCFFFHRFFEAELNKSDHQLLSSSRSRCSKFGVQHPGYGVSWFWGYLLSMCAVYTAIITQCSRDDCPNCSRWFATIGPGISPAQLLCVQTPMVRNSANHGLAWFVMVSMLPSVSIFSLLTNTNLP